MGRVAVFIGAGASYDCANTGHISTNPQFRPPLMEELFDNRTEFDKILSKYLAAASAATSIRYRLERGERIEPILSSIKGNDSPASLAQFHEITYFLQHLFWAISKKYVPNNIGTLYDLLIEALRHRFSECLIVTLNYDLLLERALRGIYGTTFDKLSDYIRFGAQCKLIKLHGSVNWMEEILGITNTISIDEVCRLNNSQLSFAEDTEIVIADGDDEKPHVQVGSKTYYPVLAVPLGGVKLHRCPQRHYEEARKFIGECNRFLFIGTSVVDESLIELLSSAKNVQRVVVVTKDLADSRAVYERLTNKVPVFGKAPEVREHEHPFAVAMVGGILQESIVGNLMA